MDAMDAHWGSPHVLWVTCVFHADMLGYLLLLQSSRETLPTTFSVHQNRRYLEKTGQSRWFRQSEKNNPSNLLTSFRKPPADSL
jgi:hypothetical protein